MHLKKIFKKIDSALETFIYQFFTKKVTIIKWQLNIFVVIIFTLGGASVLILGATKLLYINATSLQTINVDTDTDFNKGVLTNTSVSGTGSPAGVILAGGIDGNTYKKPITISNLGNGTNSGLTHQWKLDEASGTSLSDSIGNLIGTATGTAVVAGQYSNARSFAGGASTDLVNFGNIPELQGSTASWGISGWFKLGASPTTPAELFAYDGNSVLQTNDIYMYWSGTAVNYQIGGGGGEQTSSISNLGDGNWHNIILTKTPTNIIIYEDGVQKNNIVFAGGALTGYNFYLGQKANVNAWKGSIDEVRIYNRTLSSTDATALYTSNSLGENLTNYQVLIDEGEVARWKLDEASGTSLSDSSGNSNTATATGTTVVAGKYGNARNFSGSDKLAVPSITGNPMISSVSLWVYTVGAVSGNTYVFDEGGNNNWIQIYNSKVRSGTTGSYYCDSAATLSQNTWYNITKVFDGNVFSLYLNGTLTCSISALGTSPGAITIGQYGGGGYGFNGYIDEVRMYNKALTSNQVNSLYTSNRSPLLDTVYSNTQESGADLRFTDSDGTTQLSYWIDKYSAAGQNAKIWVKVPSISANTTKTIYAFYGSQYATATSSATNTMIFYDDFEYADSPVNHGWTLDPGSTSANYSASTDFARKGSKSLKLYPGSGGKIGFKVPLASSNKYAIHASYYETDATEITIFTGIYMNNIVQNPTTGNFDMYPWVYNAANYKGAMNGNWITSTIARVNGWHEWDYKRDGSIAKAAIDNVVDPAMSTDGSVNLIETGIWSGSGVGGWDSTRYYDTFYIRNTAVAEPVITQTGTEVQAYADSGSFVSGANANTVLDTIWNGGWGDGVNALSTAFTANFSAVSANATINFKIKSASSLALLSAAPYLDLGTVNSGVTYTKTKGDLDTLGVGTLTNRFVQLSANLSQTNGTTPILDSIILSFQKDNVGPEVNASSIGMKSSFSATPTIPLNGYLGTASPYFTWNSATDSESGLKGYCLYLGTTEGTSPASSKGILGTSPVDTTGTPCQFVVGTNSIDFATASYKGGSWLDGSLATPKYYLTIRALDNGNNVSNSNTEFFFNYDTVVPTNVSYLSASSTTFFNVSDMFFSWPTSGGTGASDTGSGVLGWQYKLNGTSGNWNGSYDNTFLGVKYIPIGESQPYYLDPTRDGPDITVGNNVIYFRTIDAVGNVSVPGTYRTANLSYGGEAPTFSKSCLDETGVTLTPSAMNANLFSLSWDSALASVGKTIKSYYYMINTTPPDLYSSILSNSATYIPTTNTSIPSQKLSGAIKGNNTVYVVAADSSNNYSGSSCLKGKFTLDSTLPDPANNLLATDVSIKEASIWRVSLIWEDPTYQGTGELSFKIQKSEDGVAWTDVSTVTGNSYVDTVPLSKQYYFRVGTMDNSDESKASPSYTNAVTLTPKGKYKNPAKLNTGPTVITGIKSAEINWTTDRTSDSKVSYGLKAGEYFKDEVGNSIQITDHTVNLTNLKPSTTYYYKVKWTDEDGNTGESLEKIFTTDSAPIVKNTTTRYVSINSAELDFTSVKATKVKVYYGLSTSFGGLKELPTSTSETKYSISLDGLLDGTLYYYKINTVDSEDNEYEGTILDFTTLQKPEVSNIRLQQVKNTAETTLIVSWLSNTDISSILTYYPENNSSLTRDLVNLTLINGEHKVTLNELNPETQYILIVKGRDKVGNEATSELIKFTTSTDTRPPAITELTVDTVPANNSNSNNQKAQIVISWNTDESSTSAIEYGEGYSDTYPSKTTTDFNLTSNHMVVISNLEPSKVYHFRAVSKDKANNIAYSSNTVSITSTISTDVTNLILNSLKNLFNF